MVGVSVMAMVWIAQLTKTVGTIHASVRTIRVAQGVSSAVRCLTNILIRQQSHLNLSVRNVSAMSCNYNSTIVFPIHPNYKTATH